MSYQERLEMLIDNIKYSKLNDEEFTMIYGILELSKDRNNFYKQYNLKINEIIKKKGETENF